MAPAARADPPHPTSPNMPRKKDDHMMDATRYGYMDIEGARVLKDIL